MCVLWKKFNKIMLKHINIKPCFKRLMVDNPQANENVVKNIYGTRNPTMKMVHKERTYFFH